MSSRFQRSLVCLCVLGGGMAAYSSAFAEPTQSLAERRLSIIKGSSSGIVLLDLPSEQRPPVLAPGNATAPAPATAGTVASPQTSTANANANATVSAASGKPAEAAAPRPAVLNRFFSSLPAPSGKSLQEARRLDAPDQGVPLPFARSAPAPAVEPDTKR